MRQTVKSRIVKESVTCYENALLVNDVWDYIVIAWAG